MIITDAVQGEKDWFLARAGIPTASEFDQIFTPTFELRSGEMPKTFLAKKIAEKMIGPLPGFSAQATEFGNILEDEAVPWYRMEYNVSVKTGLFILTDDKRAGCSPDGLISDQEGLEVKCPQAETHVKYLLNGVVPPAYVPQVHGSLYVTGFNRWTFLSYKRRFPPLVVTVERDEEIMTKIHEGLQKFYRSFDTAMERIKNL